MFLMTCVSLLFPLLLILPVLSRDPLERHIPSGQIYEYPRDNPGPIRGGVETPRRPERQVQPPKLKNRLQPALIYSTWHSNLNPHLTPLLKNCIGPRPHWTAWIKNLESPVTLWFSIPSQWRRPGAAPKEARGDLSPCPHPPFLCWNHQIWLISLNGKNSKAHFLFPPFSPPPPHDGGHDVIDNFEFLYNSMENLISIWILNVLPIIYFSVQLYWCFHIFFLFPLTFSRVIAHPVFIDPF